MDEMYRLSQAAKFLGIHPITLRRWADEGRIRCVRLGKERRFPASEIRRLRGEQNEDACILYGRVSGHGQKDDLERRVGAAKELDHHVMRGEDTEGEQGEERAGIAHGAVLAAIRGDSQQAARPVRAGMGPGTRRSRRARRARRNSGRRFAGEPRVRCAG